MEIILRPSYTFLCLSEVLYIDDRTLLLISTVRLLSALPDFITNDVDISNNVNCCKLLSNGLAVNLIEKPISADVLKQISLFNLELYNHVIRNMYNTARFSTPGAGLQRIAALVMCHVSCQALKYLFSCLRLFLNITFIQSSACF